MKRAHKSKRFRELEAVWYEKLRTTKSKEYPDGFKDIEKISDPDRPLKQYHAAKFGSTKSRIKQAQREEYNKKVDDFVNDRSLHEICVSISAHGNSTVTPATVKKILELHRNGKTERAIAKKIKRGKKCVHLTLTKAREWMKVA